jgi:hypothetical protein
MARAGYANVVADSFGNRLAGASVEVRQPGTATKVTGSLYAGPTGAATLSNSFVANSLGYFTFYRDAPETIDLYVTAPGYHVLTLSGVAVAVDAPALDGSQLVVGSVTTAQIADGTVADADVATANKDGAIGTPSLRTLGTGAQQAAAGNHGHAHASLSGIGANDHHAQQHAIGGSDHSGQLAHSALSGVGVNDHHAQAHALSGTDHTGTLALSQLPTTPRARAKRTSAQSIANGTITAVTLPAEDYDTDAIHDTSTNTSRLTCKTAGWYVISGYAQWNSGATGGARRVGTIRLNGTTNLDLAEQGAPAAGTFPGHAIGAQYYLAVNDYVELVVYQDSGGSVDVILAALAMVWTGP